MKQAELKKKIKGLICVAVLVITVQFAQAQEYKTGVGLLVDVGDGSTWVGPHVKHFFNPNSAGEFGLLFGNHVTILDAMYQYHQPIQDAPGLQWYLGLGGLIAFPKYGDTYFGIVPAAGLDYKLQNIPISAFFDWRPKFMIYDGGNDFVAARFGLGLRFILNN